MTVKKWIAPIVVTGLVLLYCGLYFGFLMWLLPWIFARIALGIVPLAIAGVMIYVCIQRIKEIRSGEEDDLSQY